MRAAGLVLLVLVGALFFYSSAELPPTGDPGSPPATHVSPRYIEAAYKETGTINLVTAVLADYRGYDTLGETVVIFTAGIAAILILAGLAERREEP
ncbi:MAG: hydrogen gas-evolving membrane-bound hydrogenase subunit E [Bacillota bacterium]